MKKIYSSIIACILLVVLCLSGCSDKQDKSNDFLAPQSEISSELSSSTQYEQPQSESDVPKTERCNSSEITESQTKANEISIQTINGTLTATLEDNSSTRALVEHLKEFSIITIEMSDYGGFEKVGSLGVSLPTNNENITSSAGDIILYQGNSLVIFYGSNSWSYTRLGRIDDLSAQELKDMLGDSEIPITIYLTE